MNCKVCGSPITENDQFCKNCGAAVNSIEQNGQSNQQTVGDIQNNNQQPQETAQQVSNNMVNNQFNSNYNSNYNQNNQNSSYNQIQPTNNKNSITKYIIIGIVIVAIIVGAIFAVTYFMNNDNSSNNTNNEDTPSQATPVSDSSSYKVSIAGFTFSVPDNYIYQTEGNSLMVGDEEGTWMAVFEIAQGSFSQLEANMGQLQPALQQGGYTVSAASKKTIGGVDLITLEASYSGANMLLAMARANSMYFVGITCISLNNDFDYSILEKVAPIISSVEYEGDSTFNIETTGKLDMNIISPYAQ